MTDSSGYTDAAGEPLAIPQWWQGEDSAFAELVSKLKPHHCSYPSGQRKDVKKMLPCRCAKQSHGACEHHAHELLPKMHSAKLSPKDTNSMVVAITDPRLTDLATNIYYAEQLLVRAVNRCHEDGLSQRLAGIIQAMVRKAKKHREKMAETFTMPMDTEAQRVKRGKVFQEAIDGTSEAIDAIERAIELYKQDEEHWEAMARFNRESIALKGKAASIAAERQQTITQEDMDKTIESMLGVIEQSIDTVLMSYDAERLKMAIYQELQRMGGK